MAKESSKPFGIHVPRLIPVQVMATDLRGTDRLIGDFEGGVALSRGALQSVQSGQIIGSLSLKDSTWVIEGKRYRYVFIQVMPVD